VQDSQVAPSKATYLPRGHTIVGRGVGGIVGTGLGTDVGLGLGSVVGMCVGLYVGT
jgi:hypothetical protein